MEKSLLDSSQQEGMHQGSQTSQLFHMATQVYDVYEPVRDFPKKASTNECQNLEIGSNIIGKLENDKSIPID